MLYRTYKGRKFVTVVGSYFVRVSLILYDFPYLKLKNKGIILCNTIQDMRAPYFLGDPLFCTLYECWNYKIRAPTVIYSIDSTPGNVRPSYRDLIRSEGYFRFSIRFFWSDFEFRPEKINSNHKFQTNFGLPQVSQAFFVSKWCLSIFNLNGKTYFLVFRVKIK